MHFVYILECRDGSYYVGSTQNVLKRLQIHCSGKGPDFTARRLPVRLAYQESFENLDEAIRREKQLKGWSRAKKKAPNLGRCKIIDCIGSLPPNSTCLSACGAGCDDEGALVLVLPFPLTCF